MGQRGRDGMGAKVKGPEAEREKRKKIIRVRPGEKTRPTTESLERLRQMAEEKGWIKRSK